MAALQSADCFLHDASDDDIKREKVVDEKNGDSNSPMHNETTHRTFKIYFVLSTFLLATCLALYCILRLIQVCQLLSSIFSIAVEFFQACCASGGKKAEEGEA